MPSTTKDEVSLKLHACLDAVLTEWGDAAGLQLPTEWRNTAIDGFLRLYFRTFDLRLASGSQALVNLFRDYAKLEVAKLLVVLKGNLPRRPPRGKLPKERDDELSPRVREKYARLLEFGAERIVSVARLRGRKSFASADKLKPEDRLKPGRLGRKGTPWDKLFAEWCRANPERKNRILSATALRERYYYAARNTHLARRLLRTFDREFDEAWEECQRFQEAIARSLAPKPDNTTKPWDSPAGKAFLAALGAPTLPTRELRQHLSRDQFTAIAEANRERRDAMARKHWVEFRVRQLWVTSLTNPKAYSLFQSYPLRPWFLREARGESYPLFDWALPFEG